MSQRSGCFSVVTLTALLTVSTIAGDCATGDLQLLDRTKPEVSQMLRNHFRRLAHAALDRRLAEYEELHTPEQIHQWQTRKRERLRNLLGGFPDRTPLNARVVGQLKGDGFRIEKIIYESQPGFFVTANLYLPETSAPYPGVLFPCGHSENGKAAGAYQKACMLLARNGCAALIFDPPGQGERKQVLVPATDGASEQSLTEPRFKATSEHMVTGIAPILLGRNLATYFIGDGMRGIDYLQSRDDIIPDRIGCTGNSGGGNQTSYLMALDDRLVAAAPGCFITTTRYKNDRPGPGDAEQNIFAQTKYGIDHPDYLMMRAPQPTLILAATRDFVPIQGTWVAFRQAKRLYAKLGYPERVSLAETDNRHGFTSELRIAMTRWMRRWLLSTDDAVNESPAVLFDEEELQCTPTGQVLHLDGARSVFDLNKEFLAQLKRDRQRAWAQKTDADRRELVRDVAGIAELKDLPEPTVKQLPSVSREAYQIERYTLSVSEDLTLPALLFVPDDGSGEVRVFLHEDGKSAEAGPDGRIQQFISDGETVLAIDLAGIGETQMKPWRYGTMSGILGPNSAEFYVAYMLGRSIVAMRAEEILTVTRWLKSKQPASTPIHLEATGELCIPALHAAALHPDRFKTVTLRECLPSWETVIHTRAPESQLINTVHGALKHYDLADLRDLIPANRVVPAKSKSR